MEANRTMKNENVTINVHSGQVNFAKDKGIIKPIYNDVVNSNELDNIIKGIMGNLSGLNEEDADKITYAVDIVKEELAKPEPKPYRLRNYVTLIAQMFKIANKIPTLTDNLQKLKDYITTYIH